MLSVGLFLAFNGYRLDTTQTDVTLTVFVLAAGEIDEGAFAAWIRGHARRRR